MKLPEAQSQLRRGPALTRTTRFRFGTLRSLALQARRTTIALQQKSAEVTEEMIKTNIHKIYYQLVVSKTQIGLLDANIERLQKLEHDSKELYKNGFVEKLDLDKISV